MHHMRRAVLVGCCLGLAGLLRAEPGAATSGGPVRTEAAALAGEAVPREVRLGPANRTRQARWLRELCLARVPDDAAHLALRGWIAQAVDHWLHQDDAPTAARLVAAAAALPPEQLDNPTVQLLLGSIKASESGPNRDDGTLRRAWRKWPDQGDAPRALVWLAGVTQNRFGRYSSEKHTAEYASEAADALVWTLRDECPDEAHQWLALTLPGRGYTLELPWNAQADYDTLLAGSPSAIQEMLLAEIAIHRAWGARGGGWAHTVSGPRWLEFAKHLREARRLLESAVDDAPGQALPAARMLVVAQGLQASDAESRAWLDLALRHEPDCYAAWVQYLNSRLSRWGGSTEALRDLALEVARKMDWKSDLPIVFEKAVGVVRLDSEALVSEVISDGGILGEAWRLFMDSVPETAPAGAAAGWRRANLFVFFQSYHAGQYADARKVLERFTEPELAEWIDEETRHPVLSFRQMRATILARTGGAAAPFREGELAQAQGRAKEAAEAFARAAALTDDPDGRGLALHRSACAALEVAWGEAGSAAAPWRLADSPELFHAINGDFRAEAAHAELSATDTRRAVACAWLRPDRPWRLSASFEAEEQTNAMTGVYWGDPDRGAGLLVRAPDGWAGKLLPAKIAALTQEEAYPNEKALPPQARRSFVATWDGRRLEIEVAVGEATWRHEAEPKTARGEKPWMLALLAQSKDGALRPVRVLDLRLEPLAAKE